METKYPSFSFIPSSSDMPPESNDTKTGALISAIVMYICAIFQNYFLFRRRKYNRHYLIIYEVCAAILVYIFLMAGSCFTQSYLGNISKTEKWNTIQKIDGRLYITQQVLIYTGVIFKIYGICQSYFKALSGSIQTYLAVFCSILCLVLHEYSFSTNYFPLDVIQKIFNIINNIIFILIFAVRLIIILLGY